MHFVNFIMPHLSQLVHAAWQWQLFKFPATVWTIQLNTFSGKTLQTNLPEIQCSLMPCKSTHVSLMKLVSGAFNWWPFPISTRDSIGKPKQVHHCTNWMVGRFVLLFTRFPKGRDGVDYMKNMGLNTWPDRVSEWTVSPSNMEPKEEDFRFWKWKKLVIPLKWPRHCLRKRAKAPQTWPKLTWPNLCSEMPAGESHGFSRTTCSCFRQK